VAERPSVIAVRTDVAVELLIRDLVDAAEQVAHVAVEPPGELAAGADSALAARAARHGYALRLVELERFARAREPADWLARHARDRGRAAAAELSAELAAAEPDGLPAPDDPAAATWRIPGPGGHVRHHAARILVARIAPHAGDDEAAALRRCWLYGFFLACAERLAAA
jgi:hypothetical protein